MGNWIYDEAWVNDKMGKLFFERYRQAGRTIGDDAGYAAWPSRVIEDIRSNGYAPNDSLAKHDYELREALGLLTHDAINWRPSDSQLALYRGAFCVPDAFPAGDDPYGDSYRIWTPAFLAYSEEYQDRIINAYKNKYGEYSRFVINLGGSTYHNDYPHIDDNPAWARKGITKLLNAHLIPVCCATNDEDPDKVLDSWIVNADIIDDGFVMWEMNGPLQNDTERMFRLISAVCSYNFKAKPKLHFTAGHGSIGEPEGEWWKKCANAGVGGLFSQDEGFNRNNQTGDPEGTASGLEDTAAHLHGHRAGWEGLNLINVGFEQTTTPVYHKWPGWDARKQRNYGDYLVQHCPNIAGVLDGHN